MDGESQDATQATLAQGGQPPQDGQEGTSAGANGNAITMTQAQLDKLVNDKLAAKGRDFKKLTSEVDGYKSQITSSEGRIAELQRQVEGIEEERLKALPVDQQSLLRQQRELRAQVANLKAENEGLKKGQGRLQALEREATAMEVALSLGLPMDALKPYADLPEDRLTALGEKLKAAQGQALPKTETKGQAGDSLAGKGAPAMSDADFMRAFAAGDRNSPDDFKRATKIQQARGINVGRST